MFVVRVGKLREAEVKRRIELELQRITPFGFHQTGADNRIALQNDSRSTGFMATY